RRPATRARSLGSLVGLLHLAAHDELGIRDADDLVVLAVVLELGEEEAHGVEPGALLVVGADDRPRRVLLVRAAEHLLLGLRVRLPPVQRLEVHRGELPAPYRVQLTDREADRKSTRLNSSHVSISYAVFCLKKK